MSYYYCDTEKCICGCHKTGNIECLNCNNVNNQDNAGLYPDKNNKNKLTPQERASAVREFNRLLNIVNRELSKIKK